MKKATLVLTGLIIGGSMMAQGDLTSKKGVNILPEAGEWSIGIDATPILEYAGNLFNGNLGNSAPVFQPNNELQGVPGGGFAICGKMMVDANTAYRAKVRIGLNSSNDRELVTEFDEGVPTDDMVENESKTSSFGIALGGGIEKRRGSGRLQGLYGGEAMIGFGSSSTEEVYGNDISDSQEFSRNLSSKSGSSIMVGVNGFIGVEYFVAPKVSIGGEYTWGLGLMSTGNGESVVETWDGSDDDTTTTETAGGSSFSLDTGTNGDLMLKLHFYF